MTITIYHNPDCGTSRNVLTMIRNSGEEPRIIEYLKTPPSRDELVDLAASDEAAARASCCAARREHNQNKYRATVDHRSFRDQLAFSIDFAVTRSRDLLRRILKEHTPDDARQQLADRVLQHLEQSGFEVDEVGEVGRLTG